MAEQEIKAATQYADWKGSACADDHDHVDLDRFMRAKGWIGERDYVVAVNFFSGEVHDPVQAEPIYVTAYVELERDRPEEHARAGLVNVHAYSFKLRLDEFFGLFKRFSVALSRHGDHSHVSVVDEHDC